MRIKRAAAAVALTVPVFFAACGTPSTYDRSGLPMPAAFAPPPVAANPRTTVEGGVLVPERTNDEGARRTGVSDEVMLRDQMPGFDNR